MIHLMFLKGHPVHSLDAKQWFYTDNDEPADFNNPRPCLRCGRVTSTNEPDACLGHLPGVIAACCGHGMEDSYFMDEWGYTSRFDPYRWAGRSIHFPQDKEIVDSIDGIPADHTYMKLGSFRYILLGSYFCSVPWKYNIDRLRYPLEIANPLVVLQRMRDAIKKSPFLCKQFSPEDIHLPTRNDVITMNHLRMKFDPKYKENSFWIHDDLFVGNAFGLTMRFGFPISVLSNWLMVFTYPAKKKRVYPVIDNVKDLKVLHDIHNCLKNADISICDNEWA